MIPRRSIVAIAAGGAAALALGRGAQGSERAFGSAYAHGDGFGWAVFDAQGALRYELPLPARGHSAAVAPDRSLLVAFARRPGRFAVVLDAADGRVLARFEPPSNRVFNGHGAFSPGGELLFTTETRLDGGDGALGVHDVAHGFARIGEASTGGADPHDVLLDDATRTLVVANGGIRSLPGAKLDLEEMAPSLVRLDLGTLAIVDRASLDPDHNVLSIRHLARMDDGTIAIALQQEGPLVPPLPILGLHRPGGPIELVGFDDALLLDVRGYGGSIAINGGMAAIGAPRGQRIVLADLVARRLVRSVALEDGCGVAALGPGFLATSGAGGALRSDGLALSQSFLGRRRWDNHLVVV